MPSPTLVSTAEAARLRRVHVRTIHRWVAKGLLTPVVKGPGIRGPMFFDQADVLALDEDAA